MRAVGKPCTHSASRPSAGPTPGAASRSWGGRGRFHGARSRMQTLRRAWHRTRGIHRTENSTWCQPVAPSGGGGAVSAVCTAPVLVGRATVMVCRPASRACHGGSSTAARCRRCSSRRVRRAATPSSMRTSTVHPWFCAQATPPKVTGPRSISAPSRGTSMRDSVLIGRAPDQPSRSSRPAPGRTGSTPGRPPTWWPTRTRTGRAPPGGRVAVLGGQGPAVHGDRQQRVAAVGEGFDRCADGETVDRRGEHHVGVRAPRPRRGCRGPDNRSTSRC